MSAIQMKLGYKTSTLEIPYIFIDHYLTGCAPVYPLIYIYSLRRLIGGEPVSTQEIAEHFSLLDTDVLNAWRHFEKVGLVQVEGTGPDIAITFLPIGVPVTSGKQVFREPTPMAILPVKESSEKPPSPPVQLAPELKPWRNTTAPQYSPEELEIYHQKSKDIARLFANAQEALGRLLKGTEMSTVFSFHDWLKLPIDVIEYLLSYCSENGHRDMRYIEKCALDWADKEIDDLEKALLYVQNHDSDYRSILRQLGKLSAFPTPAQQKLMDKWLHEMHMPLDVILDACDRTTLSAEKPSLSYVNKIVTKWHKSGITTLEGVKEADNDFTKQREKSQGEASPPPRPQNVKPKNNRFINFDQRQNDYTQIEQLARQDLLKRLKG